MGHAWRATLLLVCYCMLISFSLFAHSISLSASLFPSSSLALPVSAWKYAVKNVIAFNVTIKQGKRRRWRRRRSKRTASQAEKAQRKRGRERERGGEREDQLQLASFTLHVPLASRQRATAAAAAAAEATPEHLPASWPKLPDGKTQRHSAQYNSLTHTLTPTHTLTHVQSVLWFSGLQAVPLIKTDDQRQLAKATSTIFVSLLPPFSFLSAFLLPHPLRCPSLACPVASQPALTCYMACAGRLVVLTMVLTKWTERERERERGERERVALDTCLISFEKKTSLMKISQKRIHCRCVITPTFSDTSTTPTISGNSTISQLLLPLLALPLDYFYLLTTFYTSTSSTSYTTYTSSTSHSIFTTFITFTTSNYFYYPFYLLTLALLTVVFLLLKYFHYL